MRTDLDHLPEKKQRELRRIVDVLHEEFEAKVKASGSERRRQARILKIILFGSHARGGWVEDRVGGYFSDYDILIVVNEAECTDFAAYWSLAEDRLHRHRYIKTVPQFIVHTLAEVNEALRDPESLTARYILNSLCAESDSASSHALRAE